jgi:hypothetical protein
MSRKLPRSEEYKKTRDKKDSESKSSATEHQAGCARLATRLLSAFIFKERIDMSR